MSVRCRYYVGAQRAPSLLVVKGTFMDYFADNWIGILGLIIAAVGVWVAWHRKTAAPKTGVHQTMVNTRGSKQVAQTPNARQDMLDTTDSEQQG